MSLNEICHQIGTTPELVKSPLRVKEVTSARKKVCFELYRHNVTQTEIAKAINRTQGGISRLITSFNLA